MEPDMEPIVGPLKLWRPEQGPRQIFFDVVVCLLRDIDAVRQQFHCTLVFNLQWMLSEQDRDSWSVSAADHPAKSVARPLWRPPDVEIGSAIELSVESSGVSVDRLGSMLIGKCSQTVKGTFIQAMELDHFPFDCQNLTLRFIFPDCDDSFQVHPSIDSSEFIRLAQEQSVLPEYRVSEPLCMITRTPVRRLRRDFSYADSHRPTIVLRLGVSRLWMAYMYKVVLTLALVSLAVIIAYLIPHEDLSDRLAHTTTLLLISVAYQLVVASGLSQLDCVTLLDKYVLHTNVFMMLAMCLMAVVRHAEKRELLESEAAADLDRCSMQVAVVMWLVVQCLFLFRAAFAWRYVETPKLLRVDDLAAARPAPVAASSQFSAVQGQDRIYFGCAGTLESKTGKRNDFSFWSGLWSSRDFYGPHGAEYVFLSVVPDDAGQLQLTARRVTGDPGVPCGHITWRTTEGPPDVGETKSGELQVRYDITRADAFRWDEHLSVTAVSRNRLEVTWRYGPGVFVRQEPIPDCGVMGASEVEAAETNNEVETVRMRSAMMTNEFETSRCRSTDTHMSAIEVTSYTHLSAQE